MTDKCTTTDCNLHEPIHKKLSKSSGGPPTQERVDFASAEGQSSCVGAFLDTYRERVMDHRGRETKVEVWVVVPGRLGRLSVLTTRDNDGVRRCHTDEAPVTWIENRRSGIAVSYGCIRREATRAEVVAQNACDITSCRFWARQR